MISDKKPPAKVKAAVALCAKDVKAVVEAIKALVKPQAAYAKALSTRDAGLPEWTRALHKLRVNADAAWDDEPDTVKAIFALPEKEQQPARGKRKLKKARAEKAAEAPLPPPPPAPSPEPSPPPPAPPVEGTSAP